MLVSTILPFHKLLDYVNSILDNEADSPFALRGQLASTVIANNTISSVKVELNYFNKAKLKIKHVDAFNVSHKGHKRSSKMSGNIDCHKQPIMK